MSRICLFIIIELAGLAVSGCAPVASDLTKLPPTEQSFTNCLQTWCQRETGYVRRGRDRELEARLRNYSGTTNYWWVEVADSRYDIRKTDSTIHPYRGVALIRRSYYNRNEQHPWEGRFWIGHTVTFGFRPAPREKCYDNGSGDYYNGDWEFLGEEDGWNE